MNIHVVMSQIPHPAVDKVKAGNKAITMSATALNILTQRGMASAGRRAGPAFRSVTGCRRNFTPRIAKPDMLYDN
jgi:hypothetical protein